MKKLAWQSTVLVAVLLLLWLIFRIQNNSYTTYIPTPGSGEERSSYRMVMNNAEDENGGIVFDEPGLRDGYVQVRMKPDREGEVWAEFRDDAGNILSFGDYQVGRFGSIYDRGTGGFTGDTVAMMVLVLFFLGESVLLFLAYLRRKGAEYYAYVTIYLAGFSLFLLLTGLTFLFGEIRHLQNPLTFPMLSVYELISSAGYRFVITTLPFILLFAGSMIVSNVALLRHESRRLRNVMGIAISLVMLAGAGIAIFLYSRNFAGSFMQYRIQRTVLNVYATVYMYFECMLIGAIICGVTAARHVPQGDCRYIIILGCGFRKDGSLPPLLRGRVDRAVSFWRRQRKRGVDAILIPSGGQGRDEPMAEAEAMHRYLTAQGIPEECILPENRSANTYQNMEFSKKLIEEMGAGSKVVFSTTNYHVFRSGVWASLAGLEAEGIGSRTKWWFWPNAFIRECIGLLVNRWKQELLFLLVLTAVFGVLSMTV